MAILASARLRYEPIGEEHYAGLHAMNAAPEVMRYLPGRPETQGNLARRPGHAGGPLVPEQQGLLVLRIPAQGCDCNTTTMSVRAG